MWLQFWKKRQKSAPPQRPALKKNQTHPPNRDISFTKRHESRPCRLFLDLISIHKCWVLEGWSFIWIDLQHGALPWPMCARNAIPNAAQKTVTCSLFIYTQPVRKKKCTQTSLYMKMEDAPKLHFLLHLNCKQWWSTNFMARPRGSLC